MLFTPEQIELGKRLAAIFMPYASDRLAALQARQGRFVHYTTAESGLKIINSKSIWMRNTWCMNDYSEVQHGFRILDEHPQTNVLFSTIEKTLPETGAAALKLFRDWWNDTQFGTYITSISEHDDREDTHGRLSMWRAFSSNSPRVALVFRIPFEAGMAASLNLIISPVAYFTSAQISSELARVIGNIQSARDFLLSTEQQFVIGTIFQMLTLAIVCLKHEGFHEEREWRVMYWPKRRPSALMSSAVEVVAGVPQVVYKIPLLGGPPDLDNLAVPQLIDRVIIGPSPYPWAMYQAFVAALAEAGVTDAAARVTISGIPLRT